MYEIRKFDYTSSARYSAIFAFIGVLIPVAFGIVMFFLDSYRYSNSYYGYQMIALLWLLAMPFIAAVIGFAAGLIYAAIYNALAPRIGGMKIEILLADQETKSSENK